MLKLENAKLRTQRQLLFKALFWLYLIWGSFRLDSGSNLFVKKKKIISVPVSVWVLQKIEQGFW